MVVSNTKTFCPQVTLLTRTVSTLTQKTALFVPVTPRKYFDCKPKLMRYVLIVMYSYISIFQF